ncbi:MAG: helicase [Pirellula sp.]|nr:helicase [Pirellula sp.]
MFAPNSRVRLKGDPARRGILTGQTRPGRRGDGLRYQVSFPDATSWVPSDQLEIVPVDRESPVDLLQAGKLGRVIDLRRTLTHVRLTGRLADVIYSMETTNTDFYPYQFKPVLRFLMSPSNALLIADEVGLGKTIEAGLVWTELRSRFDLRRLVVLCPAVLRDKWRRELADKMGVRAEVVDAAGMLQHLQDRSSSLRGFALICSLQGARPNRDWESTETPISTAELARFLRAAESDDPLIDMLIIDEAHYLRNPDSQTNELGRLFRSVTDNLLMLSATPIHNYNQDLFSLLQLLDADTFQRPSDLESILEASRPLVNARDHLLKPNPSPTTTIRLLDEALAHPLLKGSRQLRITREEAADPIRLADRDHRAVLARRLETINPLAYVITRTRKRDIKEWRVIRDPTAEKVSLSPCERKLYDKVTDFVIDYALSRAVNERFILATPQRQMSSSMPATLRAWRTKRDNIDDMKAEERERLEIGPLTQAIIDVADDFGDFAELRKNDSKYRRLKTMLKAFFQDHPDEKIVLFSTFRETLNYLGERLSEDGIVNAVMHGGVKASKEEILLRFRIDPSVRILLSSEVGSEGIDLQFCRVLVNYDLPWNPMRVEQRIGRLDRLGQEAQRIVIWNLFYDETIDARIYERLYEKLDLCRQALGDFEAILGDQVRDLTTALISDHLTPHQQEERIDQTAQALANLRQEQEHLEGEAAHLVAYGDYIMNQVQAARELNRWITGDDLRAYFLDFFRLHFPGCLFRRLDDDSYEIELSIAAKQEVEEFVRKTRLPSTRLTQNSARPVCCRFENRAVAAEDRAYETISQFHPVVRFISQWINDHAEQLHPAVSLTVRQDRCEIPGGIYLLAVARWSVEGLQSLEKLAFAASRLDDNSAPLSRIDSERLAMACALHGEDWFEAGEQVDLPRSAGLADEELFGALEDEFNNFVADVERQNDDRADLQLRNLMRHLDDQRRKLDIVLDRHRLSRRESLVKATEGRIQALRNRTERKSLEIEGRRKIRFHSDEVLVAVVRVS